jgi:sigma-70-like protein
MRPPDRRRDNGDRRGAGWPDGETIVRSGWKLSGRAGADRVVAYLYRLHYRSLVRLAALLVPDLATAEDIVQDAFVALHSAWPAPQDQQGHRGAAMSLLRRLVIERSRVVSPGRWPGPSGLVSALQSLPARQREVLGPALLRRPAGEADRGGDRHQRSRSQVVLAFSALRAELPSAN